MRVSVVDPWRMVFEGNVEEVILPGEDGELCVLDFHHPFLYRLCRGMIQLKRSGARRGARVMGGPGAEVRIAILDGVARMAGNELVIVVEVAESSKQKAVGRKNVLVAAFCLLPSAFWLAHGL